MYAYVCVYVCIGVYILKILIIIYSHFVLNASTNKTENFLRVILLTEMVTQKNFLFVYND